MYDHEVKTARTPQATGGVANEMYDHEVKTARTAGPLKGGGAMDMSGGGSTASPYESSLAGGGGGGTYGTDTAYTGTGGAAGSSGSKSAYDMSTGGGGGAASSPYESSLAGGGGGGTYGTDTAYAGAAAAGSAPKSAYDMSGGAYGRDSYSAAMGEGPPPPTKAKERGGATVINGAYEPDDAGGTRGVVRKDSYLTIGTSAVAEAGPGYVMASSTPVADADAPPRPTKAKDGGYLEMARDASSGVMAQTPNNGAMLNDAYDVTSDPQAEMYQAGHPSAAAYEDVQLSKGGGFMAPPARPAKAAGGVYGGDTYADDMPWLHGALNRIDAEALLKGKNKGAFLVRTKANVADSYVLTLKLQKGKGCEHHKITTPPTSGDCVKINRDELPAQTLKQAIKFLMDNPDQMTVPLRKGISKQTLSGPLDA